MRTRNCVLIHGRCFYRTNTAQCQWVISLFIIKQKTAGGPKRRGRAGGEVARVELGLDDFDRAVVAQEDAVGVAELQVEDAFAFFRAAAP